MPAPTTILDLALSVSNEIDGLIYTVHNAIYICKSSPPPTPDCIAPIGRLLTIVNDLVKYNLRTFIPSSLYNKNKNDIQLVQSSVGQRALSRLKETSIKVAELRERFNYVGQDTSQIDEFDNQIHAINEIIQEYIKSGGGRKTKYKKRKHKKRKTKCKF